MTALPAEDARDRRDELVMDRIRTEWHGAYDIGYAADAYLGRHLTGGPLLSAATPEGLESAIKADWVRRSAR